MNYKKIIASIAALTLICGAMPAEPMADFVSNMAVSANAETAESDFYFDSSTGTITGYNGAGGDVVIPSEINGMAVTSIGRESFENCKGLTSVTIPNSVTSVGEWAFHGCSGLTSVTFADKSQLTSIDMGAFYECPSLTNIEIPDSVTSIGSSAFYECSGLTSVTIPDSVTSIFIAVFSNCSGLTSITIPDSVTSIGDYAFQNCKQLTSIVIPDSVTSIGDGAFNECISLTSITIPDSVTSIGDGAFKECISLPSVTIPDSVTSIGSLAFGRCSNLISIVIPKSVKSIGAGAFEQCTMDILYTGSKDDFDQIQIDKSLDDFGANDGLYNATKIYNYRYIKSASLALDGTLKVNIKFNADITEEDGWTINGEKITTQNKIAVYGVAAKNYKDEIVIKCGDNEVQKFTIADMIAKYKDTDDYKNNPKFTALIDSLEEYCEATKAYFTEGENVADYSEKWETVKSAITPNNTVMGDNYYGSSLLLKSGTILRHYYTSDFEGATEKDEYFYKEETIAAHLYSNDSEYSVNDYIYKVLANEESDDNLKSLCVALYNYGEAAKAYYAYLNSQNNGGNE